MLKVVFLEALQYMESLITNHFVQSQSNDFCDQIATNVHCVQVYTYIMGMQFNVYILEHLSDYVGCRIISCKYITLV